MFSLFKRNKQNPTTVIRLLLKSLNVKVSPSTLVRTLEEHPDYPNLLAISDSLAEWHLPNQAFKISKEEYNTNDLQFPFVAHLNTNGGIYMLVHEIKDNLVTYSNELKIKGSIAESDFLNQWSGVALYVQKVSKSGEKDYKVNLINSIVTKFHLPLFIFFIIVGLFQTIDFNNINLSIAMLLLIKLIGVTVSILLLIHSIDANNPFIQNLCSLGQKNNCNAILKSDAAKVTSWLSWSEVGFYYFTGTFISLLFVSNSYSLLAWLNLLALPYTIYSVSFQYKHKNWCVLCCTVQAILIAEFLININTTYALYIDFKIVIKGIMYLLLAFTLPILSWVILKPILLKAALTKPLKNQLRKFKYNSDLFNQILQNQPRYAIPDDLMPIALGNTDAKITITMVSNPFCEPCAKAHQVLDEWIKTRDDIQLKVVFSTANHDNDQKTKVARHLRALSLIKDNKLIEEALNDWYNQSEKKYENWALSYPVNWSEGLSIVTEKQKKWCELTEITFTPTIFINGYKLPQPYRLEDIKYLIN